jgi:hypothetical protein
MRDMANAQYLAVEMENYSNSFLNTILFWPEEKHDDLLLLAPEEQLCGLV